MRTLIILAGVTLLVQSGCGRSTDASPDSRKEAIRKFIAGADRIEIYLDRTARPDWTVPPGLVLTKRSDIADLTADLVLAPKKPCDCGHSRTIRFWRGKDVLSASICDHCFDVIDEESVVSRVRVTHFKMPERFWEKLCRLEQEQQNKTSE